MRLVCTERPGRCVWDRALGQLRQKPLRRPTRAAGAPERQRLLSEVRWRLTHVFVFSIKTRLFVQCIFSLFSFLLNLLGWHWLPKHCTASRCTIPQHVLCVHGPESSLRPPPLTPFYPLLPAPLPAYPRGTDPGFATATYALF